jgi:hypothetical protein
MTNTTRSLQIYWVLFPTSMKFSDNKQNLSKKWKQATQMHSKTLERKLCDKITQTETRPNQNRPLQDPYGSETNLISKAWVFLCNSVVLTDHRGTQASQPMRVIT